MKRLLKGFTLAEVLVTLAIIGVVASLTLPVLNANVTKQQVGPALAKAINTLENANMLAIKENGVRTLVDLTPDSPQSYFDVALDDYVHWKKEPIEKLYYGYDSSTPWAIEIQNTYTTDDGIAFLRDDANVPAEAGNLANLSRGYSGQFYMVYVDVNGNRKGPNSLGKDLFALRVDTKGFVIPVGGVADAFYQNNQNTPAWRDTCDSSTSAPRTPINCAGSIVDNGFNVIY